MSEAILLTGGSGLLGGALRALAPDIAAPPRRELDILDPNRIAAALDRARPTLVLHAAGLVGSRACEDDPARALAVNVGGTLNLAIACAARGVRLAYVSTDYVFDGARGDYREDDVTAPVNVYGHTKLAGEWIVRALPAFLIIRLSFYRGGRWKHPAAFVDQYSSALPVDTAAARILAACRAGVTGVLHIAGPRRRLYDIARDTDPAVRPMHLADAGMALPRDASLNAARWDALAVIPTA